MPAAEGVHPEGEERFFWELPAEVFFLPDPAMLVGWLLLLLSFAVLSIEPVIDVQSKCTYSHKTKVEHRKHVLEKWLVG